MGTGVMNAHYISEIAFMIANVEMIKLFNIIGKSYKRAH